MNLQRHPRPIRLSPLLIRGLIFLSAFASFALMAVTAHAQELRLELSPDQGPIGTRVTISGEVPFTEMQLWTDQWAHLGYFHIGREFPPSTRFPDTGCELLGAVINGEIHLDPNTRKVTGSFTVPSTGTCFQARPDERTYSITPGTYWLSIGCHACQVATFTITGQLPRTGFRYTLRLTAGSVLLIALGWYATLRMKRNST